MCAKNGMYICLVKFVDIVIDLCLSVRLID